jgi:hypothetical protein
MKFRAPTQLVVALAIIVIGGGAVGAEYVLVKWYPIHRQAVTESLQKMLPYENQSLGIDMQVAAGIYGKVQAIPDGVRIYRPEVFGPVPSLTIVSQPNPDGATEFSPDILARWETDGVTHHIPGYLYDPYQTQINGRNAAVISQIKNQMTVLTAHLISKQRILQVDCAPGVDDQDIYVPACRATINSIKLDATPPTPQGGSLPAVQPTAELLPAIPLFRSLPAAEDATEDSVDVAKLTVQ